MGQSIQRSLGEYTVFTIPFEDDSVTFAVVARPTKLVKPNSSFSSGILTHIEQRIRFRILII